MEDSRDASEDEGGVYVSSGLSGVVDRLGSVIVGSTGFVGRDAPGEGGGRTNEVGSNELVGAKLSFSAGKAGAGMGGITSVSYERTPLTGEASDRPDTR